MSRWRDTLCGSVLLWQDSETPKIPERIVLADERGVLHCGGVYFPSKIKAMTAKPMPPKAPEVITLPTSHYSVMILREGQSPTITTESPMQACLLEAEIEFEGDWGEDFEVWATKNKF